MAKDYIDLKIDTERHLNGEAVAKRLRGERGGGIPWMVVVDAAGEELLTGDGPDGNIGCPVTEAEREWFMTILGRTRQHMSAADVEALRAALADHAAKISG